MKGKAQNERWGIRWICLLTALFVLVLTAVGCGRGAGDPDDSTPDGATRPPNSEDEEEIWPDLKGRTFIINTCTSELNNNVSSNLFIEGSDDKNANFVSQMAYARNGLICEKMNADMKFVPNGLRYHEIVSYFDNLFLSQEPLDLIMNKLYPLATMSINGSFYNIASNNYFDFFSDYWYTDWMDSLSIDGGNTCYLMAGDFFIDVLRYCGLIIYNDRLFNDLYADEGGTDAVYDLIQDGGWTIEKLLTYSNEAYLDVGDDGKTAEDRYGWCASQVWYNGIPYFIGASDLQFLSEDGTYLDMNNDRSLKLFSYMKQLFYGDGCMPYSRRPGGYTMDLALDTTADAIFRAGRGLFLGQSQFATMELLTDYDSWSVLPYPKLDAGHDYVTPSAELTEVGAIPRVCSDRDSVLILLEYLNRATADGVMENYYETCLQHRYAKDPKTREMVVFIHDHLNGAFEQAYNNYLSEALMWNTFYVPLIDGVEFTTAYKSVEGSANKKIEMMLQAWQRNLES